MRRLLGALLLVLTLRDPVFAAAALDGSVQTNNDTGSNTSVSFSCNLGTGANKAVLIGWAGGSGTAGLSGTVGGEALTVIAGTNNNATAFLGKATSLTGSQTIALSWTNGQTTIVGCYPLTGVDQTTPFNNGGGSAAASVAVTSTSGDLTASIYHRFTNPTSISTNQTQQYNITNGSRKGGGDTGPGTGTTTHTWTPNGGAVEGISGVNIKAAAAAATGGISRSRAIFLGE